LQRLEPDRSLYFAITLNIYRTFFVEEIPQIGFEDYHLKLIVFDSDQEAIVQWIN